MTDQKKKVDGRRNNKPPKEYQFGPGKSGNPNGRPRKKKNTFTDEIKSIFGQEHNIQINGKVQTSSTRALILQQIAHGAAKGDPKMIKLSMPFLKMMDDAPEFEPLPEDKKIIKNFMAQFDDDGNQIKEDEENES